jgi:4-aminobutyrate aminotransferase-like enzyme
VAIELGDDAGQSFAIGVQGELLRRGYILARRWGVPVLRLDPSLTIEEKDISGFLRCFGELVAEG